MDTIVFFTEHPTWYVATIATLALIIGSFLNVVIYRLPRMLEQSWNEECRCYLGLKPQTAQEKLSLYLPFSHCPRCKKNIRPWHNIPILSYLLLRGKCAYCRAPISLRYPLIEAFTAIVSLIVAWHFGITWQAFAALLFTWIVIALIFIDLEFHLLPDQLTLLLLWLGLFFSIFHLFCTSEEAIIGSIAGYSLFALIQMVFQWFTGKIGMGQGDFKFLAALGAFLGWQLLPFVILFASISGIIITLIQMLIKKEFKSTPIPFGPYLAVAGWVALLFGQNFVERYLALMY